MIFSSNYHGAEPSEAWEDGGRFTKIPKIVKLNVRQQSGCRFLCANIYNAYQYMVVLVKTSINLNQDDISAHCSFKIVETIEDCEFPSSETVDSVYMGPIIAIGAVLIITIIILCVCWYCKPRTGGGFN